MRKFHDAKTNGERTVVLWGSGNPRREFVFSEDAADASVFAVMNAGMLQNTHYNIGTGIDYSIRELAELIADVVGYKGKIAWDASKPDGAPRKLLDSSKFLALGWKPAIVLKDGIRMTYEWFLRYDCY
jgi:GDP-L-fucose synthase